MIIYLTIFLIHPNRKTKIKIYKLFGKQISINKIQIFNNKNILY